MFLINVYIFTTRKKFVIKKYLININNFTDFMTNLKKKFEKRIVDFKKIQNVIQPLDSSSILQPYNEWINETVSIFKCDKASL